MPPLARGEAILSKVAGFHSGARSCATGTGEARGYMVRAVARRKLTGWCGVDGVAEVCSSRMGYGGGGGDAWCGEPDAGELEQA